MRGLSLWQPWASLVAYREKLHETRSWGTAYRGEIAIHATTKWQRECVDICRSSPFFAVLAKHGLLRAGDLEPRGKWPAHPPAAMPFGSIVAIAELTDCWRIGSRVDVLSAQEMSFGNWTAGRFAWKLENVRRLTSPVPVKGAQGLWIVQGDEVLACREQLAE